MRYLEWKKRALLMASGVFWLPSGLARDNVLAAYQFKGVGSEAVALSDLSGNGRNLTKIEAQIHNGDGTTTYPTWSTSKGFFCRAGDTGDLRAYSTLNNDALNNSDIQSAVVCFADMQMDGRTAGGTYPYTKSQIDFGCLISAGGSSGYAQLYACTTFYLYTGTEDGAYQGRWVCTETPGLITSSPAQNRTAMARWGYGPASLKSGDKASGVVGGNFVTNSARGSLYVNGVPTRAEEKPSHAWFINSTYVSDSPAQGYTFGSSHANKNAGGDLKSSGCVASKYLIAAAFFNCHLTAAQHAEVAAAMLAI